VGNGSNPQGGPVKSPRLFQFRFFRTRRRAITLPATLLVVTFAACTASAQNAAPQSPSAQTDSSRQSADPVQSKGDTQPEAQQTQPAPETQKPPLIVNPVTGLANVSASGYRPLTGRERWRLYWKQNYLSVGAYFGPAFVALALDQTTNSPPEWHGGIGGYGRRFASRTATATLQGTFQAPLAALLHEDVRYITSDRATTGRRILHALVFGVLTYNGQGHRTVNIGQIGGSYAAAAVSTAWLPERHSLPAYTLINGSEQIGIEMAINLLQEFWPEATRYLPRLHHPQ
jgi:hypothetical protein